MSHTSKTTVVAKRQHKRADSMSRLEGAKERRRIPSIEIDEERDVSTLVSMEIARAMLTCPDLDLGIFLETSSKARRDLSVSDSTILISAAILEHLKNKTMSDKLLSSSATLTGFYEKMGLKDKVIRGMFVTMLFSMNPMFVKLIERTIKLNINRSAALSDAPYSDQQIANALVRLTGEGTINNNELVAASNHDAESEFTSTSPLSPLSFTKTPREMIAPDDSASVIKTIRPVRRSITQDDMMTYLGRRKSGIEPRYESVFTGSRPPISIQNKQNRYGLGYEEKTDKDSFFRRAANRILGSQSVLSYDMSSDNYRSRKPKVEDYLESEEVSGSVFNEAPEVNTDLYYNPSNVEASGYAPTEMTLRNSRPIIEFGNVSKIKEKDSLEEIRGRVRQLYDDKN